MLGVWPLTSVRAILKIMKVTNAATVGNKYCPKSGQIALSTKLLATGLTSGVTVYLTVVRDRPGFASEGVVTGSSPPTALQLLLDA